MNTSDQVRTQKLKRQLELQESRRKTQLKHQGSLSSTAVASYFQQQSSLKLIAPVITQESFANEKGIQEEPESSSNIVSSKSNDNKNSLSINNNLNVKLKTAKSPSVLVISNTFQTNSDIGASSSIETETNSNSPANPTASATNGKKVVVVSSRADSEEDLYGEGTSVAADSSIAPIYDPTITSIRKPEPKPKENEKDENKEFKVLNGLSRKQYSCKTVDIGSKIQCKIVRYKEGGANHWYPYYELYIESPEYGEIFLLSSRKRKRSSSSSYVISTIKLTEAKMKDEVIGKLRSNFIGTSFTIFDDGRNPFKEDSSDHFSPLRCELGTVIYETNVLGLRGPRKMTAVIPAIGKDGLPVIIQPIKEKDTIHEKFKQGSTKELVVLRNKSPQWNEDTQSYVLNFAGRVTMASVKNFQIVHENDVEYIVMQFGRVSENIFSMDFQYPMSPIQAFGIALTSFDEKLACE